MSPRPLLRAAALALLAGALAASCALRQPPPPLPGAADLEPDRLILLTHGYVSDTDTMTPLFDALMREGVPRGWLGGGEGRARYHLHAFDYSRFTAIGSDHNVPIEALTRAFSRFYHDLPESCAACRGRLERPVEVTLVGRSFGGMMLREFMLQEALEHDGTLRVHHHGPGRWEIKRMITLATPFFGSVRTRLTQGFLSLTINGLWRTVAFGFVNPSGGGVFGNVIDEQARALQIGSLYQWNQQMRWQELAERGLSQGYELPPWLTMVAVGHPDTAVQGDAVTRFASANMAPMQTHQRVETFAVDIKHMEFFRNEQRGRKQRELDRALRALTRFVEFGTLEGDESGWLERYPVPGQDQAILVPRPDDADHAERDAQRRRERLDALFSEDQGDVWLRFFDGRPDGEAELLPLSRSLSVFRAGLMPSRIWTELVPQTQVNADGEEIPVVQSMGPAESYLIAMPDFTPTGDFQLLVRVSKRDSRYGDVALGPDVIQVRVEGQEREPPRAPGRAVTVHIDPHQTNLVSVYLDGDLVRSRNPRVGELDIHEVALVPITASE